MELGLVHVRFAKIHICNGNNKFKIFLKVPRIMLDVSRVVLVFRWKLPEDYMFFSTLNNCFKTRLSQTTSHPSG